MFMSKKKLKLSIIASIIINSTYSYALNNPSELISTNDIKFEFESVHKDSLRGYDSNRQIHGRMDERNLPTILTSKHKSIIITSDKDNINISYDVGKSFNPLKIKNFDNISVLSLSENGRYLTAHGKYNNNTVFFVYDIFLKESNLFNPKNNISYYIEDDYYFTTNDGLFSLYSEDNDPYAIYTAPSEKKFFIFDNENKKSIPLNEWNKTKLNNHIEKNKFIVFEKLTSFNNLIKLKPNITAPSFSGKYLYGTLQRENQKSDSVRLAFLYDQSNDDIKIISNSDYGSSRINQLSKNDIAVGWIESRIKRQNESDNRLIREAFIYHPTQNKIRKPTINSTHSSRYYNSEATAISENGEFFVGWVEYGDNLIKKRQSSPLSEYPRNAFVYFVDEEKSQLLLNLNNNIEESEAHSISKDGNAIFGVSKGSNNEWKLVAWNIGKTPENKTEENQNKEAINIKYDTLLATNDIEKTKVYSNLSFENLTSLKKTFNTQKEALSNRLEITKTNMENASKEKIRIENIIDEGDKNGGSATYDQYSNEYHKYKNREDDYKKEIEDINLEITTLNNGTQNSQLKLAEYEYAKSQTTLNALTQKNAAIEAEKARAEQERLDREKQRLADEAKEQQRLAEEKAKELIPVEDELELRAKEKEKNKPSVTISKPIDIENTYKSMQLVAENSYKFMDMQQGQLRYLASATCSVGTKKACISGFTHYQNVNKANATQTGLSGAYRFDVNHIPLIVGLAIDTDVYSSLPKGYQYQGYALPLIGFSLDLMPSLNAELNNNALHLSLKGAYLNRKVSIERQALANTEQGKGNAKITGYHIELQGYYPYSIADDLLLTPFAGLTFNQISRSAYSETQNAQFAAHYDALKTHSLLAKMGLGMDYLLGSSFILNTKAGLLWNLSHHQGDFRSQIDYLGQQHIDYSENKKPLKQRPFAHVGLTYQFDKQSSINTSANWEMTPYRNHDMQFGISYTYRF